MLSKLFSNMDLYKGIIIASVVLTPVAGWWAWSMNQEIREGRVATHNALKRGGDLETIGIYQKQLMNLNNSVNKQLQGNYRTFFEQQVLGADASGGLRRDQFVIGNKAEQRVVNNVDYTVDLEFREGSKHLELKRDFIQAVCFNVESQSGGAWKLRELHLRNKDTMDLRGSKAPPPELSDIWRINQMKFATREPASKPR